MAEADQRRRVLKALKPLHGVPVENPAKPGTPDVNCIPGWLELKWLRRWPKGVDTPVRVEHFTPQQRRWLRKRWFAGGPCWVLLQVGREWLLFEGPVAATYLGKLPRADIVGAATRHWQHGLKDKELRVCLEGTAARFAAARPANGCS